MSVTGATFRAHVDWPSIVHRSTLIGPRSVSVPPCLRPIEEEEQTTDDEDDTSLSSISIRADEMSLSGDDSSTVSVFTYTHAPRFDVSTAANSFHSGTDACTFTDL